MKNVIKNVKRITLILALVFGVSAFANAQNKSTTTKTVVKIADLQKSITDNIAKDYAGYTIKDAYKIDKNKVITYYVNVVKDTKTLKLSYDSTGKFLKAVEQKPKTNHKKKTQ